MICPNCGKEINGEWCGYCGAKNPSSATGYPADKYDTRIIFSKNKYDTSPGNEETIRKSIYDDDSPYPFTTESGNTSGVRNNKDSGYLFTPGDDNTSGYEYKSPSFGEATVTPGKKTPERVFAEPDNSEDDEIYASEYDELVKKTYEDSPSSKKKVIIICSVVVIVISVAIISYLLFFGKNEDDGSKEKPVPSDISEIDDTGKLEELAQYYIDIGDFKSAEETYKKLHETDSKNNDADILYNILYNYNKAESAFEERDIAKARKNFDNIPAEYVDYAEIETVVDELGKNIEDAEKSKKILENVKDHIDDEEYEIAEELMKDINDDFLDDEDKELYDKYEEEIEKGKKAAEEEDEDEEDEKITFSKEDAEELLFAYCQAFVDAINEEDFEIVAKYIHEKSTMYNQQKTVIESYIDAGTTERFDWAQLNTFKKTGNNKWEITVTEAETLFYADGDSETKTFNWTYTIQYIDSEYYFTKIQ